VTRFKRGRVEPEEPGPGLEVPVAAPELDFFGHLLWASLGRGLKRESLDARRDSGVLVLEQQLRRVEHSDGLERIIHELRRAPALAPLDGRAIAIEVVPTANPYQTELPWRDRVDEGFLERMHRWSEVDPTRLVEARLPVGLAFDLFDLVPDVELLRGSEIYNGIYENFGEGWVSVVLHRDPQSTWLLTCWHHITNDDERVRVRTSLQRLTTPLREACHRIGLFTQTPPDGETMRNTSSLAANRGPLPTRWQPQEVPATGQIPELQRPRFVRGFQPVNPPAKQIGFPQDTEPVNVGTDYNHYAVKDIVTPAYGEWSLEELKAERARLTAVLEQVDEALLQKLNIADAVPVRELRYGVRLIDRFETDPRSILIYVEGTDRLCLLRPADSNSDASETVLISSLSQRGSELARRATEGGEVIAIRRGRGRTERIVAELAPLNIASTGLINVFLKEQK
jgi:hypothetical protein